MSENNTNEINVTAEKLAKNPLGIIALFIVLVYALSASTLIFSQIPYDLQKILIYFIVIFPVFVLVVFFILVTKHHDKLYSPSDFKDESNFMETRYPITGEIRTSQPQVTTNDNSKLNGVKNDIKSVQNTLDSIEKATKSTSKVNNKEVSKLVEIAQEAIGDVKTKLDWSGCNIRINELIAEYSAIQKILLDNKIPIGKPFGTNEKEFGKPEVLTVTFNQRARISHIRELVRLLTKSNIKIQGINYTFDDNFDTNTGIYVGSYSYQNGNYAKVTQELLNKINDPQITKKQLINTLKTLAHNANH